MSSILKMASCQNWQMLPKWQMSLVVKIDKYHKLSKLANIINCQKLPIFEHTWKPQSSDKVGMVNILSYNREEVW